MSRDDLKEVEFCIVVLWLHGYPISRIHRWFGRRVEKTEGAIRGMVNRLLPKPRSEMSHEERQAALDQMWADKPETVKLDQKFFIALRLEKRQVDVAETNKERKPPVKPKRKTLKQIKREKVIEAQRKAKREEGPARATSIVGGLECALGHMSDPSEIETGKVEVIAGGAIVHRRAAAEQMRTWLESAYLSGMKTQNYESVGGGSGAGVVIHAHVAEAVQNLVRLKKMLRREDFDLMDQVFRMDQAPWLHVKSAIAEKMILEDLRRGLDTVALYLEMISLERFKSRWGHAPGVSRKVDGRKVKKRARDANTAISEASRKAG